MANGYYEPNTYQHLFVTTREIPRVALFTLPFNYTVSCTRNGGWELYRDCVVIAAEYHETEGLKLDVKGFIICDSLTGKEP